MSNEKYIDQYKSMGPEKFYGFLLTYAISKLIKIKEGNFDGISPETEFLDYAERFLRLYRREDDAIYLDMSKTFRKAGHKIYRLMRKQNLIEKNKRFLQAVK
jgi:hypothetical protein